MALRGGARGGSLLPVTAVVSPFSNDVESLRALLTAALLRADEAEACDGEDEAQAATTSLSLMVAENACLPVALCSV